MGFSDKGRFWWWLSLTLTLTGVSVWRLLIHSYTAVDVFIFIFWFILILFPIISEISVMGISIKKEIENAKNEIKGYINQINVSPTINNIIHSQAEKNEYENKTIEDIKEDVQVEQAGEKEAKKVGESQMDFKPQKGTSFTINPHTATKAEPKNERVKERFEKITSIEKQVGEYLISHGLDYQSQIKWTDTVTGESLIVDGIIKEGAAVREIIEIKFITRMSFDRFYYLAINYIRKIRRFGLRIPVRFIVVSEDMDEVSAKIIKEQIVKANYLRSINNKIPHSNVQFFAYASGSLREIELSLEPSF